MHIRIPFLAVLIISIFQLTVYGLQNNNHSTKDFNQILTVEFDDIAKISMSSLSNQRRSTIDPEQIESFINYFNQFQYKRLMNDQTTYMPKRTITVYFYAGDEIEFIIPYMEEAFITHKVYSAKNGTIEQDELIEMFLSLPDN